jgi:hypothetical protein
MKVKARCDEPGCLAAGAWHPVTMTSTPPIEWVSPRLFCKAHRKGKGHRFLEQREAERHYGKGWRLRATETRPEP